MTRQDIVSVKARDGGAAVFTAGRQALRLAAGEIADKWLDGSPITRGEFEDILAREEIFEVHEAAPREE